MKKIFISCDMEGTAGVTAWDETEIDKAVYPKWAHQMSREAAAACNGAVEGGAEEILLKDAHDFARNIDPALLPECARIFRGWGRTPLSMMAGIDESFSGAMFTGYHSGAGMETSPLSHTMNTRNMYVKCNGELMPEAVINAMTASYFNVPMLLVAGDQGICDLMKKYVPNIETVAVSEGQGAGSISIHPDLAVKRISEAARKAVQEGKGGLFPIPDRFVIDICYKEHSKAKGASWYPGMTQKGPYEVSYQANDLMDVLTMFHFVL